MGFSVYISITVLVITINEFCSMSMTRRLECIPVKYCGLVWNIRLPCCENEKFPNCGRERKFSVGAKIYGGAESALGEFPWIVQIFYRYVNTSQCIGSLITQRFVLSAAHCASKTNTYLTGKPIFVRLGEHDISSRYDCIKLSNGRTKCSDTPLDVKIISFMTHPNYSESSHNRYNDIAIFRFEKVVSLTDFINTICLPVEQLNVFSGKLRFMVSGWGETRKGTKSNVKLKAMLSSYDFVRCSEIYKSKSEIILNNGQMCAGGEEGYDTCRGDSGGPLMYYNQTNDQWILVGVVSFGPKRCGSKNFPGVYANVHKYVEWITNNTKD